ncbi:MAG TPA: M4 family metallopeptidase [Pilimelia sp.]|nr:M4 family metallopeptidase [Pilimelia sp.]
MRRKLASFGVVALTTGAALAVGFGTTEAKTVPDSQPAAAAADPQLLAATVADRAADSGLDALAKGPEDSFVRQAVVPGAGGLNYVRYHRTYRGLPVVGGDAVVTVDDTGNIRDTTAAEYGRVALRSVTPRITAARATATAKAQLKVVEHAAEPQLVVYALTKTPRLAWEALVEGAKVDDHADHDHGHGAGLVPSRLHVFVDALTGKVLDTSDDVKHATGTGYYLGRVTFDTSRSGSNYVMTDPNRSGLRCGGQDGQSYTNTSDTWGNGSGTDLRTACVDAFYAAQKTWDMLGEWLNRRGYNGNGGGPPARVGLNQVNAFWNGSYTNFGRSQDGQRQVTPIDVVAHEYGHAIDQYTGGAAREAGLGEATGDIFGALAEHYINNPNDPPDYTVGEEVNLVGRGPIRNMYNPSLVNNDPNCWSSAVPGMEVHKAAGPLNHWFYLLAEGSNPGGGKPSSPTCNNSTVVGIGIQKAGKIFMGAMNKKTSGWTHARYRVATLQSAVELYGAASTECNTVKAAWNAISFPAQSGEPQCQSAPSDNFSISVSPTAGSVQQGQSVTTTVSTRTTQGNAQTVTLSASGLPAGVTASFNPPSVTSGGSSTLTLTASASATVGAKAITITGTAPSGSHTATYSVTVTSRDTDPVDDFSVSVSPGSATVEPGGSATASVATATTSGNAQALTLSVSGAPTGVTASIDPSSVTSGGSATLSVQVASTVARGSYPLTVTASGTSGTKTATFTVTVQGDDPPGGCNGVPAWSATTAYSPGAKVSHNGRLWNSTWYSTGAEPGAPQSWAVWADAGAC